MQYIEKEGIKLQKEQFDITGMTCSACSARVEKSVSKLPGIQEVAVNLLKNIDGVTNVSVSFIKQKMDLEAPDDKSGK